LTFECKKGKRKPRKNHEVLKIVNFGKPSIFLKKRKKLFYISEKPHQKTEKDETVLQKSGGKF